MGNMRAVRVAVAAAAAASLGLAGVVIASSAGAAETSDPATGSHLVGATEKDVVIPVSLPDDTRVWVRGGSEEWTPMPSEALVCSDSSCVLAGLPERTLRIRVSSPSVMLLQVWVPTAILPGAPLSAVPLSELHDTTKVDADALIADMDALGVGQPDD